MYVHVYRDGGREGGRERECENQQSETCRQFLEVVTLTLIRFTEAMIPTGQRSCRAVEQAPNTTTMSPGNTPPA